MDYLCMFLLGSVVTLGSQWALKRKWKKERR